MRSGLLITAAFGLLFGAGDSANDTQKDLQQLQGTWKLVSAQFDGKALAEEKVKHIVIVFKGNTFLFPESAENATSKSGTIKIDASKRPKQMDAISTDKIVMLGIYELNGNSYKVCFAPEGKPRPSELSSKAGSGNILQLWERAEKK